MKKNQKGFTLVELLAAIVILGILMLIAVPQILGLVENNKNKIYVNDAKKLIASAEYKMRAASDSIEKPDPGDCIAISLVYLDSDDFETTPNNGEYLKEASYVLVKANDTTGRLEYSASLIEKMDKGGYKGVELTTNEELLQSNATKHVRVFEKDEIVYIEGDESSNRKALDAKYINKMLGGSNKYIEDDYSISGIYNYPDVVDNKTHEEIVPPVITRAVLQSKGKDFASLQVRLSLKVRDDDSSIKDLKVYLSETSYSDAYNNEFSYGTESLFTYDFDFSKKFNYKSGGQAHVYIIVRDGDKNEARKHLTYDIHLNEPPKIIEAESSISKRPFDAYAGITAYLTLSAVDDITDTGKLDVCLKQVYSLNDNSTDCPKYEKYNSASMFGTGNNMEYNFNACKDATGKTVTCKRDGSHLYLKAFVRDEQGSVTSKVFDYQTSQNKKPEFVGTPVVESRIEPFVTDNSGGASRANVIFGAEDLEDGVNIKGTITYEGKTINFDNSQPNKIPITFDNLSKPYDGKDRTVTITLRDSDGATTSKEIIYKMYKNKPPVVKSFDIQSNGFACSKGYLCPKNLGGNYNSIVTLTASDDIDYSEEELDNMAVCISTNASDCTAANKSNYKYKYSQVKSGLSYTLQQTGSLKYRESNPIKRLYVSVMDSYGEVSNASSNSVQYNIYTNQAPKIKNSYPKVFGGQYSAEELKETDEYNFEDDEEDCYDEEDDDYNLHLNNVRFKLPVIDEFDSLEDLTMKICYKQKGNEASEKCISSNFVNYSQKSNLQLDFNRYEGQTYEISAQVKDQHGDVVESNSVEYVVYKDKAPVIIEATAAQTESSADLFNKVILAFVVKDEMDTFGVCVSESKDGCTKSTDFTSLTAYDGSSGDIQNYTYNLSTTAGESKNLYLFVKDSYGNYGKYEDDEGNELNYYPLTFTSYNICDEVNPEVTYNTYEPVDSNDVISAERCNGKCYFWPERDDISTSSGEVNDITAFYKRKFKYKDKYTSNYCGSSNGTEYVVENYEANCGFISCFRNVKKSTASTDNYDNNVIGLTLFSGGEFTQTVDGNTYTCTNYYRLYESTYTPGSDTITLTYSGNKLCAQFVESDKSAYKKTDDKPYLRALDID